MGGQLLQETVWGAAYPVRFVTELYVGGSADEHSNVGYVPWTPFSDAFVLQHCVGGTAFEWC